MRVLAAVLMVFGLLPFSSTAAAAPSWPIAGMVALGSGHWGKTDWTLAASEPGGSAYCIAVAVNGTVHGASCGSAQKLGGIRVGESAGTWLAFPFLHGAVVSTARVVTVTLSDGRSVRGRTIAPLPRMKEGVAFFAVPIPCGVVPRVLVALGIGGQVVADRVLTAAWPSARC